MLSVVSVFMLSVLELSYILSVLMLNVIFSVLMLSVINVKIVLIAALLSVFMLSVVVLNVAAPTKNENSDEKTKKLQGGIEAAKKANRCLKSSYKNFFSCMHGTRIQTF
jgi:hypothetical protein